jgi:2-succinyl-5-enolpyruvyl-6-hydroxy-3-cyclohexene-1-carboxylate synthase
VASDVWSLDGPVHVNLPFREPLVGTPLDLPGAVDASGASSGAADVDLSGWVELLDHQRGVVVAGRGVDDPSAVDVFATSLGWPVLADPRSGCRGGAASVVAFDSLMRNASFAAAHTPTVVLHLGEPPASKVLGQWLQASGATHLQVLPRPAVIDPLQIMQTTVVASVADVCARLAGSVRGSADTPWLARWRHADAAAQRAIVDVLARNGVSEPGVCRALTEREGALVVSSSMPIRDVEWFGAPEQHADLWSNRGANGIDGVIATGIGVALTRPDRRATVLLGDVAFCHDSSSLTALRHRDVSVSVVVLDNDGGGIFSFLPQASLVTPRRFEQLFGTPHGTDVAAVGAAHGLAVCDVTSLADLHAALDRPGSAVIRVRTTRDANVALHARLHDAVSAAL